MAKEELLRVGFCHGSHRLIGDEQDGVKEANKFLWALGTRGLSPRTIRAYAYDLLALYRWMNKDGYCLETLTQATLLNFIAHEQERNGQPSSINRRLTVCRLIHSFYYPGGLETTAGTSLPAPYYRGPGRDRRIGVHMLRKKNALALRVKMPNKQITPLNGEQVREFLRSLRRYRDIAIVHLMLLCGLRSREVLLLDCRDVSLIERQVRVMGKGSKERIVPLADLAAASIEQYLTHERLRSCTEEALFVCLQGKRRWHAMTPAGLRRIFRTRRKKSTLAGANPHRFRHTFGVDMARCGVTLSVLQKLMGHATPEMTLHYINLSLNDIADAYRVASKEIQKHYELE
ncbi:MAG: tyrosine-type recombinase/integrase [Planctomycetes bacterium]|nr:tyrosine-type recombinase/integrase [Planctomycetota bacterium]